MPKRTHKLTVGRYQLEGEYEAVPINDEGELGMPSKEWERLELEAAIVVFSQPELINGEELRFARKAMSLTQPALAERLEVTVGTVSRWETGAEPIQRQTQLAVLLLLYNAFDPKSVASLEDKHVLRRIDAA